MAKIPDDTSRALAVRNEIVRTTGECKISLSDIHAVLKAADRLAANSQPQT